MAVVEWYHLSRLPSGSVTWRWSLHTHMEYCIDGNFCLEKFFPFLHTFLSWVKLYPMNVSSHINNYIEPMAIFTTFCSAKYFHYVSISGLGGIFVWQKFSAIPNSELSLLCMQYIKILTSFHFFNDRLNNQTSFSTFPFLSIPPVTSRWMWSPAYPRQQAAWALLPTGHGSPSHGSSLVKSYKSNRVYVCTLQSIPATTIYKVTLYTNYANQVPVAWICIT